MKSFDTDLKKYAEKVSLKASERRELRERVLSYMEYHPLPKQTSLREERAIEGIPSESFVTFHFTAFHARIAGGLFALLVIIAPFIAEKSVPGDALYLVKTGLNETVQGKLANSPYEKIEFETKLMERRIAEARVLASEGKLTEEVKTQLAETVKGHTEAVQNGLAELRTQDADGAAIAEIAFNSSLEVQSAVLAVEGGNENSSLIETIRDVVDNAREEVVLNQEHNDAPSFDGLVAQVELETTRAYELFTTIKVSATEEEVTDIERRLSDINRLILEAKEKHIIDPTVASDDLVTTLGLTQKLIVFMTDIDVREAVALETLVPVVLSDVERIDRAREDIRTIDGTKIEVEKRLETILDLDVTAKVTEGIEYIDDILLKAGASLEVNDIQNAEGLIEEGRILVHDLDTMTKPAEVTDTPEAVSTDGNEEGEGASQAIDQVASTTPTDAE